MTEILCLAPSPSVDVTYVLDTLRLGDINRPDQIVRVPGGKGLNAARAAHELGARVRTVATLGATSGEWIAQELSAAGIDLTAVDTSNTTRTCVSIAATESGYATMTEIYERAEVLSASVAGQFIDHATQLAGEHAYCTLSGSIPMVPADADELFSRLRRTSARIAIDLSGDMLSRAIKMRPHVIKVNRSEAMGALGIDSKKVEELAEELHAKTAAICVVTDGINGVVAIGDDERVRLRTDVRGAFPVGSGDTFLGVLVARLAADEPLRDALRVATAASVANALSPGAAVFEAGQVEDLLPRVTVTPW